MKILAIYDNPDQVDRFTIYYGEPETHKGEIYHPCLCMSESPYHPMGYAQHSLGQLGPHNGKEITFDEIPVECRRLVNEETIVNSKQ